MQVGSELQGATSLLRHICDAVIEVDADLRLTKHSKAWETVGYKRFSLFLSLSLSLSLSLFLFVCSLSLFVSLSLSISLSLSFFLSSQSSSSAKFPFRIST